MNNLRLTLKGFNGENTTPNPSAMEDFKIEAYLEDTRIAYLCCYFEHGRLYAFEVEVLSDYRRQKVATKMYDYAQELSGRTIHPHHTNPYNDSESVSNEALGFWKYRGF